jgi:cysteine synthase B
MTFDHLVGSTRLVELTRLPAEMGVAPGVSLLAKLEGDGPGGSVKDRAAWGMIQGALSRGEISTGDRLVEATSGNTAIALAMVGALLGLHVSLIVPSSATVERVQAMRASDNWRMHYRTTGPEIWRGTEGGVTHFVSAMGTTGTIMGTSRFLKEQSSTVLIVGTQPAEGSRIPGIRRWSRDMVPAFFEPDRVDRTVEVSEAEAGTMTRRLARAEGLLAGMSTGGALFAAIEVARKLTEGTVVFVVCDRGDRYLSSDLFEEGAAG